VEEAGSKQPLLPMSVYQACAKLCIDISYNVCRVKPNSLLLYLTHKHAIIETFATGDASKFGFSTKSTFLREYKVC
jgi:hypothetical protein